MKIALLLTFSAGLVLGQAGNRAAVRTSGLFELDGNVVYNVYVATGTDELEQVTISAAVPLGTRFLESVHKPLDARYEGVRRDTVSWTIAKVERDTVLGPFAFRVKPVAGSGGAFLTRGGRRRVDTPPTATVAAAVSYERPLAELVQSPPPEGILVPLAKTGTVVFDQRGTLDAAGRNGPVPVGDTGIVLFVPDGAVTERVTLTFTRLSVEENKLPTTNPPTWWCSLYQITSTPQVRFSKSISLAVPSRRGLTPGVQTSVFATNDLTNWQKAIGPSSVTTPAELNIGFGGGGFNQFGGTCISQFGFTTCGFGGGFGFGGFGGFGYVEQDNLRGRTSGVTLGTSAIAAVTSPPSIIAVLIGIRP